MYIVKYGDAYLHDPRGDESLLTDAKLSGGLNQAGSLVFTMAPNHPLLGTVRERDSSSPVEVYDGGVLVFAGYVWELSQDFKNTRTASCKGELAYLGDSLVRPYSTVEGEAKLSAPSSVSGYFQWLIDQHNSRVSEAQRFDVGRNEGALLDKNDRIYRASSQIPTTSEELQSKLLDGPGGYVFVRRENGRRVIDYLADCVDVNAQVIDFGVNLLDYARTDSASSLYTAIRPKGGKPDGSDEDATLESLPDGTYSKDARFRKDGDVVYDVESVRKYGMIELEWSDSEAVTADGLLDSAVIALKEHTSPKTTIEIKAVDMSMFMDGCSPLRPGQLVRVRSKPHGFDSYMLVAKIDPDLNDPSQTVYTLGTTFDAVTGETNKQIRRLNASINAQIDAVAGISAEAKEAAEGALRTSEEAQTAADAASEKANQAADDLAAAEQNLANVASRVDATEKEVSAAKAAVATAQAAADKAKADAATAQSTANTAKANAATAQTAANNAKAASDAAQGSADKAQTASDAAKIAADAARAEADKAFADATQAAADALAAKRKADEATAQAASAKADAAQVRTDLAGQIKTVTDTMAADYTKKTDLTLTESRLMSEIERSAAGVTSTVAQQYAKKTDLASIESGLQTQITQNAEAIVLRATKAEVDTAKGQAISSASADAKSKADAALAGAKSYADAQIKVQADRITSSAAATDALGARVSTVEQTASGLSVSLESVEATANSANATAGAARAEAANAAKTATNYMQYTSAGLEVGNRSSGAWAGFRTRMTSSAFQVLDAAGSVLASYGANLIELGKGSQNAVIELCGSLARIMRSAVGGISITSAKRIDLTAYESGGGAVSSTMRVDASAGISIESSNGMRLGDGRVQSAKRLYDNASGTAGTVTLAETAASFDYLEILFGQDTRRRSVRVPAPNGKVASCSLMATNASACWWYVGLWSISGTAMTCAQNRTYNHGTAAPTGSGEVRIYRVLGIKE